ncbi:MAG: Mur ligase family protein, partial [Candidatus Atribacteria bacterium]|nr:Mur ligase family protein [Candidatus Atribacteria bacterium]
MASIVLGLGKTGLSVARFLIERGTMVYGYDDWKESGDCPSDVIGNNHFRWISHSEALTLTSREVEEGVVSPGLPGVHPILRHLEAEGIPVVSEIELASRSIAFPLIGVTGSNGKSTTVSLIGTFLSHAGYSVFTGGNLGTPLLDAIRSHNHYDWGVVELSSFQLERIYTARFQVAGILNLYPNHLDRHLTLVNYFATKKRIFENQKRTDLAVVNLSTTPWHTKLCREVPSRIVPITTRGELREGFFFHRDTIIEQFLDGGKRISCQGWRLPGFHNRENLLFACAVARTL